MRRTAFFAWIAALFVLLTLSACANNAASAPLTASGYLETYRYRLSAEIPGTVAEVLVQEGQTVQAGAPLLRLRSPDVEAALQSAQAALQQAQAAWDALNQRPTEAEVAQAQAEVDKARAQLTQAQKQLDLLDEAYAPLEPPAEQRDLLAAQVEVAQAALKLAQARLAQVQAGPTKAEKAQAQAALQATQVQVRLAQMQQERLTLTAPVDGTVGRLLVKQGEVVQPGVPLVLLDAAQVLEVVVYIPAARLDEVQVGQHVQVSVDAYPGETFRGRVVRIADQALFTPSEVLSREERVKRVFAVTIRLEEGLDRLHPGMPADVTFEP